RATAQHRLEETTVSLDHDRQTLTQLTQELESRRVEIDSKQQAFRDGQLRLNELSQQIEQHKAAVLDLMRTIPTARGRISSIEIERKNISAQQTRLAERRQVVVSEIETIETQRGEIQKRLDEVIASLEQQQSQMNDRRNDAAALGKQIA